MTEAITIAKAARRSGEKPRNVAPRSFSEAARVATPARVKRKYAHTPADSTSMMPVMMISREETSTPNSVRLPGSMIDSTRMLLGPNRTTTSAWMVSMSATDTTTWASAGACRTGRNTR